MLAELLLPASAKSTGSASGGGGGGGGATVAPAPPTAAEEYAEEFAAYVDAGLLRSRHKRAAKLRSKLIKNESPEVLQEAGDAAPVADGPGEAGAGKTSGETAGQTRAVDKATRAEETTGAGTNDPKEPAQKNAKAAPEYSAASVDDIDWNATDKEAYIARRWFVQGRPFDDWLTNLGTKGLKMKRILAPVETWIREAALSGESGYLAFFGRSRVELPSAAKYDKAVQQLTKHFYGAGAPPKFMGEVALAAAILAKFSVKELMRVPNKYNKKSAPCVPVASLTQGVELSCKLFEMLKPGVIQEEMVKWNLACFVLDAVAWSLQDALSQSSSKYVAALHLSQPNKEVSLVFVTTEAVSFPFFCHNRSRKLRFQNVGSFPSTSSKFLESARSFWNGLQILVWLRLL